MTEVPKEVTRRLVDSGDQNTLQRLAREGWPVGIVSDKAPTPGAPLQYDAIIARAGDIAGRLAALDPQAMASFLANNDGSYYSDPYARLAQAHLLNEIKADPAIQAKFTTTA